MPANVTNTAYVGLRRSSARPPVRERSDVAGMVIDPADLARLLSAFVDYVEGLLPRLASLVAAEAGKERPAASPRLLTFDQAGEVLGVSRRTIDRLVERGELPAISVGERSRRIPTAAIDAYCVPLGQLAGPISVPEPTRRPAA